MSKKKSLGSSPIAFKSKKSTMGFIPDRGVSKVKKDTANASKIKKQQKDKKDEREQKSVSQKNNKKKIVSYYLEIDLIDRVKSIADKNDMYYSALVTSALENWIAKNN